MGSVDFYITASGPTLEAAFKQAREDAAGEHGHGGYTGTIAEKHEVTLIHTVPLTEDDAMKHAYGLIDICDPRVDDKWGPAGALPIRADGESTWLLFGWASY
ncbi:hypothetical protein [Streptomyces sp. NPDC017529]|uniref:hypothetical protein n=1 Tax=Streptomyces sp. NPDC017529 TaxID=3365000 RepID=UPI00379D119E